MNPNQRFTGRIKKTTGQIPWHWAVKDAKHDAYIAWGEEFDFNIALKECLKATAGARWWHCYKRKRSQWR